MNEHDDHGQIFLIRNASPNSALLLFLKRDGTGRCRGESRHGQWTPRELTTSVGCTVGIVVVHGGRSLRPELEPICGRAQASDGATETE